MDDRAELTERLRFLLSDAGPVREVTMFGGHAFMVNEAMVVCAFNDGDLLVRADPAENQSLLARSGAAQAFMGQGRSMGPSWISVDAAAVAEDADLRFWVEQALAHNRTLTG